MNWVFHKSGVLARIYGDNVSQYEDIIASLPADMQKKMTNSRDCKRLIDPNACSDTCVKGFVYALNGQTHKKCRNEHEVFVDATHVKACANNRKVRKRIAKEEPLFYKELLKKEINEDSQAHGKKPLKDKGPNEPPSCGGGGSEATEAKTVKSSTTDPESGWLRKDDHKHVFVYAVETACDKMAGFWAIP